MYCPRCGNKIKNGSRFCNRCGLNIQDAVGYPMITAPPKNRKKMLWVISIILAAVVLAAAITLVMVDFEKLQTPDLVVKGDVDATFSTEIPSGFVFDDAEPAVISGEPVLTPTVSGIVPATGSIGAKVRINGNNLINIGLTSVMIGETEMNLYSVSDDLIEAVVPFGAQSGDISIVYADQTLDAGVFEVIPQQKQLLAESVVQPSADAQTLSTDTISVTIPGGALTQEQAVRIESFVNPQPINLPETISGTAFSITAGDIHEFNDIVLIDLELPADIPGEPSAAYFDESTSMWDTLPSEVVDGRLYIYTDHLTDFYVYYWGKAIYSPDGYFKIYYQENDSFLYVNATSMDDLAQQVGVALEEARKDYEEKIPAAYRENFTYLGVKDAMDVYLDSGYSKGTYNAMTNNILLPTSFPNIDDFETMSAHELFHSYQDAVWNEIKGIGTMGNASNMWAVEAVTELAAYELAFPEKNRERHISGGVTSQDSFDTFDEVHEYSMSCFLRYLLEKTNSSFEELWISLASSNNYSLEASLNDFFKLKSADFISMDVSYIDFWRDVAGDSDAPLHDSMGILFYKRMMMFQPNQHMAAFSYQPDKASTTAFNLFTANAFSPNIPLRIFNVECTGGSVVCTKLSGIKTPNMLNDLRVPDGFIWDSIYADSAIGDTNQLYSLKQDKDDMVIMLLEAVQANTPYSVKVSEIQAQCKPQKIDNAIPGMEQEIKVAFKDIFSYVKEVEVEIDFGDGTVKRFSKPNETGVFSGNITHTFGEITKEAVTFSMYDVSGGGRDMISQLVIPLTTGEAVILSASPNPAAPGEAVRLNTNISNAGYSYRWDFGDGQKDTTNMPQIDHVFISPGTYITEVTVLNADGRIYGTAKQTVSVSAVEVTPETTGEEPYTTAQTQDYSYLYGTWKAASGVLFDMQSMDTWCWDATLILNEDGTCSYDFHVMILYDRSEDPDPYASIPPYDAVGGKPLENESQSGEYGIYDKEEGALGSLGGIEFGDGSGGYIDYDDGKLYFDSIEFTKTD